ncbi:MAG: hypothetical protein RLZZ01_108, partial [Actinomycetota bacterium]
MMNKLLPAPLRDRSRRRGALLTGLAAVIAIPLSGTLPVSANDPAAPIVSITPQPPQITPYFPPAGMPGSTTETVRYTISSTGSDPFWLTLNSMSGYNSVLSSDLNDDGLFMPSGLPPWPSGFALKPVDPALVDAGGTAWQLVGAFPDFSRSFSWSSGNLSSVKITGGAGSCASCTAIGSPSLAWNSNVNRIPPQIQSTTWAADRRTLVVEYDTEMLADPVRVNNTDYAPAGSQFLLNSSIKTPAPQQGGYENPQQPESAVVRGSTVRIKFPVIDWSTYSDVQVTIAPDQIYTAENLAQPSGAVTRTVSSPGVDIVAPPFESASLDASGTALTLTFEEDLTSAVPATSAFTVKVGASTVDVSSVANSGATSVLTLGSAVSQGARVTVSYTKPVSGGLQDAAGNQVESFSDQAVTNNSTVAPSSGSSDTDESTG